MKCRMCENSKLTNFLDLGKMPLVDKFPKSKNKKEKLFPLKVAICNSCKLVQLSYLVPPHLMFNSEYAYESSTTQYRTMIYDEMAKKIYKKFKLEKNDIVVDIGSNVGVLLQSFKNLGADVLGIEPSSNIAKIARKNKIQTMGSFFDKGISTQILKLKGPVSVITATNVFAHIHNYDNFMNECLRILDKKGIFVFQSPYLLNLIKNTEYDTIYHEHVCYLSITPLKKFFKKFNMEIFDIDYVDIDGGSIRCYVSKRGTYRVKKIVDKYLLKEKEFGLHTITRLKEFSKKVEKQRTSLNKLLEQIKNNNKQVVGLSAPAKGVILLNYCKIGNKILDYVTEKSKLKIGKLIPGMQIPVKSDDYLIKDNPDYALILAWNFSKEIIQNLDKYKKQGGKFIIPIPTPKIV